MAFQGFTRGGRRRRLLSGACLLVLMSVAGAAAQPAGEVHALALPAQPLGAALTALASRTGLQIAFDPATVRGLTAPPLAGPLSAGAALDRLLAGTGLVARFTGPAAVVVERASAPSEVGPTEDGAVVLDPITVAGGGLAGGAANGIAVSEQDLDRRNPDDIADVFRGEPKVAVGSSIPVSQKVYVQGVEETNLAVSIDGSRQNNKIFHHNATTLIDPKLLKAARVDAGVAPADAGPGALGGAILYETKDAADLLDPGRSFGAFATSSYETNSDTFSGGVSAYGIAAGFEYLGYLAYTHGGDFADGDGVAISGSGTELLSGLGKLAYTAETGDRFEIGYERVGDDSLRPFRANIGGVGRPMPDRLYDLVRQNVVFTYTDTTPEGWWDPKVVVGYSVTDLTVGEDDPSAGTTDSLNGRAENRFAFEGGSLTAGIDLYHDSADYSDATYSTGERATNLGVYAQARVEPFDRTRLSFGLRADNQWFEGVDGSEVFNAGLSGNLSGEVDVTETVTLKAGYSHVFAGIPLAENFILNPDWDYGDGPEPVTADNLTAGVSIDLAGLGLAGLSLEGNVFRTAIHDARTPSYGGGPTLHRDFVADGFDVAARYDWASGFARLSFARVEAELDDAVIDSYYGNYIGTPLGDIIGFEVAHTFQAWGLTVGGDVEIALPYDDTYVADAPPDDERRGLPGYEVVNLFVELEPPSLPNLTLRAEVKNLLDETYSSRATYGQDYVGVTPLREPGRSFKLTATARF